MSGCSVGLMRFVADGPVGRPGGWNHHPFAAEPAHTLCSQLLALELVQKQAAWESLRIGPDEVSWSTTRLPRKTLLRSTPSAARHDPVDNGGTEMIATSNEAGQHNRQLGDEGQAVAKIDLVLLPVRFYPLQAIASRMVMLTAAVMTTHLRRRKYGP